MTANAGQNDKTGQTEYVISIRVIRAIRGYPFAPIRVPMPCGRLGEVKSRTAAGRALAVWGNHGLH